MKKILITFLLFSFNVSAKLNVVASLPEFAWAVSELAGESTETISLLNGNEDPHFVDATPSFILKTSKADMVVANGMMLEIGWLPKAIQMSGNGKVQVGAPGYCDASTLVAKAQIIKNYDRSMGDVHPVGNPHYSFSPVSMIAVMESISKCLITHLPEREKFIFANLKSATSKLNDITKKVGEVLKPLKGRSVMTYHREFVYYFKDFGIKTAGTLEKVPGILPSASHLFEVAKIAKKNNVKLVFASLTNPRKYLDKFQEMTDIPYIQLPLHLSGDFKDYYDYQLKLAEMIIKNVKNK